MADVSAMSDSELEALRVQVRNEIEKRERFMAIPSQISELVDAYVTGGGDRFALVDLIEGDS